MPLPRPTHLRFATLLFLLTVSGGSQNAWSQSAPGDGGFVPPGFADEIGFPGTGPVGLVQLSAEFSPAEDDHPAMIAVTAEIADGHHIFSISQAEGGPQPTTLRLTGNPRVKLSGDWVADPAPETHVDEEVWTGMTIEEHYGEVTWRAPIVLPTGVDPATLEVSGVADLQACTEYNCHLLNGLAFTASVVPAGSIPGPPSLPSVEADDPAPPVVADLETTRLLSLLGASFLGGLILNLMPCVLPVIGLKVLSFAEQAGHDRGRILAMNLAYSAGLMSVFVLLAALAAFAAYGWGELNTLIEFKVGMIVLVFAMALSFLGVWEIPIPGFVGGSKSNKLQQREGYAGAFFKGVFTTILATPCSGPFLGSAIGFTLAQPAWVTFAIFGSIGLGMASPYLLIGLFPSLVQWLPKPGAWMETFKQLMGFVLMGTALFLFSSITAEYYLPVLATLLAIALACWVIGSTPFTASWGRRLVSWMGGASAAVLVGVAAFWLLGPSAHALPWKPYSETALNSAQREGQTVLVEFTANWCLTCKLNLKRAINTEEVRNLVETNRVQPLLADWTDKNDEIKRGLESLGSRSIPLLAIYPSSGEAPILLRDLITEQQLLDALRQAGASRPES